MIIQTKHKIGQRSKAISTIQWRWQSSRLESILTSSVYLHSSYWETEADNTRTADCSGPFISLYTTKSSNERKKDSHDVKWRKLLSNFIKGFRKGRMSKSAFLPDRVFVYEKETLSLAGKVLWGECYHSVDAHLFLIENVRSPSSWLW